MIYRRCQCGKCEHWDSGMPPQDCEGCEECNTTYATNSEGHKKIEPHELITMYDEKTGHSYKRCKKCYKKIK